MSYVVLALGALLSLCGAVAIFTGYPIIEVERGWASVISGSMAFSCGIVTLALGLLLHKLSSLHALLKAGNGVTTPWREPETRTSNETPIEPSPGFAYASSWGSDADAPLTAAPPPPPAIPIAAGVRNWPQRPVRSNFTAARNFLKARGTGLSKVRGPSEPDHPLQKGLSGSRKPAPAAAETPPEPDFDVPDEMLATKPEDRELFFAPAEELPGEPAWRPDRDDPELFDVEERENPPSGQRRPDLRHASREVEGQSTPATSWPAESASIETITEEQLFIELNRAPNAGAKPPSEMLERTRRDFGLTETDPMSGAGPAPPLEQVPVSGTSQGDLAIVGQYESAGTSYVMYSDGSIEARTANAVFHFKSMAELKTFLESEAHNAQR